MWTAFHFFMLQKKKISLLENWYIVMLLINVVLGVVLLLLVLLTLVCVCVCVWLISHMSIRIVLEICSIGTEVICRGSISHISVCSCSLSCLCMCTSLHTRQKSKWCLSVFAFCIFENDLFNISLLDCLLSVCVFLCVKSLIDRWIPHKLRVRGVFRQTASWQLAIARGDMSVDGPGRRERGKGLQKKEKAMKGKEQGNKWGER